MLLDVSGLLVAIQDLFYSVDQTGVTHLASV